MRNLITHKPLQPLVSGYGADPRLVWVPDAKTSRVSYWGAPQTIEVMGKAVIEDAGRFETRRLVEAVCEQVASKDYTSEYLAAYYFLLQRTRYMRDPRITELVRAPWVTSGLLLQGRRPSLDCDDLVTTLAAMCQQMGGRVEFVTCAFTNMFVDGRRQYSHVFLRALEPRNGKWIVCDPVAAEKTNEMLGRIVAYDTWPVTS